jgi:site-specific recombinase XerD
MTDKNLAIFKDGTGKVELMAARIAKESPQLKDLTGEQLEQIAKIVITRNLADELNTKSKIANIDYEKEKAVFLMTAGKTGSGYTRSSYLKSLITLEKYTKKNDINILIMNTAQADDFIYSLKGSPNSIRLTVAGISAFYSYLERRYSVIKNPIRGTKARPGVSTVKDIEIPNDTDMLTILNNLPELEKAAVYIMAYRGLRVGALNGLKVRGTNYKSFSKGKTISGEFPSEVAANIKYSELNNKTPFETLTTNALKLRIYRHTLKLRKEGKIRAAYSAHDFRHYFAITEYQKDKDIYRVSKLLDHSNIAITETYLRSINIAS